VICINRNGAIKDDKKPYLSQIEWVKGDAMKPEEFGDALK
jgi:hypothetical protein